jgi:hypothetical protein
MLNITSKRNNTFLAMLFEVLKDGNPLNLNDTLITMVVRASDCAEPIITLDNNEIGGLTITDAVNGLFEIDQTIFTQKKGVYDYSITFDVEGLGVFTWITGKFIID